MYLAYRTLFYSLMDILDSYIQKWRQRVNGMNEGQCIYRENCNNPKQVQGEHTHWSGEITQWTKTLSKEEIKKIHRI